MSIQERGVEEERVFQERRNQVSSIGFFAIWRYTNLLSPVGIVLWLQFFDWFVTGFVEVSLYPYVRSQNQDYSQWSSFMSTMPRTLGFLVVLYITQVVRIHPVDLCILAPLFTAIGWMLYLTGVSSYSTIMIFFLVPGKVLWAGGHLPLLGHERRNFAITSSIPLDFRIGGIYLFAGKGIGSLVGSVLGTSLGTSFCFGVLILIELLLFLLSLRYMFINTRQMEQEGFLLRRWPVRFLGVIVLLSAVIGICSVPYFTSMRLFMDTIARTLGVVLTLSFTFFGAYLWYTNPELASFNVGYVFFSMLQMEFVFGIVRYMSDYISMTCTGSFTNDFAFGYEIGSSQSSLFSLKGLSQTVPWLTLVSFGFSYSFYLVRRLPIMIRYLASLITVIPLFLLLAFTIQAYEGSMNILLVMCFNIAIQLALVMTYSEILNAVFCYIPHSFNASFLMVLLYEFHSLSGNAMRVLLSGILFETSVSNGVVDYSLWTSGLLWFVGLLALVAVFCVFTWFAFQRALFSRLEEDLEQFRTITEVYLGRALEPEEKTGELTLQEALQRNQRSSAQGS